MLSTYLWCSLPQLALRHKDPTIIVISSKWSAANSPAPELRVVISSFRHDTLFITSVMLHRELYQEWILEFRAVISRAEKKIIGALTSAYVAWMWKHRDFPCRHVDRYKLPRGFCSLFYFIYFYVRVKSTSRFTSSSSIPAISVSIGCACFSRHRSLSSARL